MNPDRASQLIARARDGDSDALGALLDECREKLTGFIARRMGLRLRRFQTAEDLRQIVEMEMLSAVVALRPGATYDEFLALVFQHARWALLRHGARNRRLFAESDAGEEGLGHVDSQHSTGVVTKADQRDWLTAAMNELEGDLKDAVVLRLAGKTFAEVGEQLGVGEDAARKRVERAIARLAARSLQRDRLRQPPT